MLKNYKNESDIPESLREHYTKGRDGLWHPDVETSSGNNDDLDRVTSALDKERNSRRALNKQLKELLGGMDPEEAKEKIAKARELEEKEMIEKGDVEKLVQQRIAQAEREHQAYKQKNQEALEKLLIENEVTRAAGSAGVHETAIDDLIHRVRSRAKVEIDETGDTPVHRVILQDNNGNPIYGRDGQPLPIGEFVSQNLTKEAPHLFRPGSGSSSAFGDQNKGGLSGSGTKGSASDVVDEITPEFIASNAEKIANGEINFNVEVD